MSARVPKASSQRENAAYLFLSSVFFSPFFPLTSPSGVNTRSGGAREVGRSKEPGLPSVRPSAIARSYKALVSFVYLGRQVTQFCCGTFYPLTTRWCWKGLGPGRGYPRRIRPDKFGWPAITIGTLSSDHERDDQLQALSSRSCVYRSRASRPGNVRLTRDLTARIKGTVIPRWHIRVDDVILRRSMMYLWNIESHIDVIDDEAQHSHLD